MKTVIALLLIVLTICLFDSCTSSNMSRNITSKGYELVAESGQISVRVTVIFLPESEVCKASFSWRWGAEGPCPPYIISALEVKENDKPIFIPFSAFADLGNPRTVKIESRNGNGQFAVILTGGDAATSYSAILEFRDGLLIERVVRHGEFPDESWEKTIYKFNIESR